MKTTAICLLAALLVSLLAACTGANGTGTNGIGTPTGTTTSSMTTSAVTSSGTTSGALSSDTGTTSGMIAGTTNGAENGTSGGTQNGADANAMNPEDAKIMYNSALYSGTKEEIRTDELGRELITVTLVDSTPQANGEASGVAENTKLYAIRDINDYSAIAFNCGGVYYRATKEA